MTTFSLKFCCFSFLMMVFAGFTSCSALAEVVSEGLAVENSRPAPGTAMFHDICKQLNLSSEQQMALDQNRINHMYAYRDMMSRIFGKRQELHNALQDPRLDIMAVTMIHKELVDLIIQQEDQHLSAILDVRKILSPEQFAQFQQVPMDQK